MTIKDIQNSFSETISHWENDLMNYSDGHFAKKPDENAWSVGQVYQHINSAAIFGQFMNIDFCLMNDDNEHEQMNDMCVGIFAANSFPDIKIYVPPSPSYTPNQPGSKTVVKNDLEQVKKRFADLAVKIEKSSAKGKISHPALGFLNAAEWLQFVDIHFRHHLRQKARLDAFLKSTATQ